MPEFDGGREACEADGGRRRQGNQSHGRAGAWRGVAWRGVGRGGVGGGGGGAGGGGGEEREHETSPIWPGAKISSNFLLLSALVSAPSNLLRFEELWLGPWLEPWLELRLELRLGAWLELRLEAWLGAWLELRLEPWLGLWLEVGMGYVNALGLWLRVELRLGVGGASSYVLSGIFSCLSASSQQLLACYSVTLINKTLDFKPEVSLKYYFTRRGGSPDVLRNTI